MAWTATLTGPDGTHRVTVTLEPENLGERLEGLGHEGFVVLQRLFLSRQSDAQALFEQEAAGIAQEGGEAQCPYCGAHFILVD